jgi:uncharacterized protein (TIGR03435 family)
MNFRQAYPETAAMRTILSVMAACLGVAHAADSFEVASIRPAAIAQAGLEGGKRSKIEYTPTSLTMRNVDVEACVEWAYDLPFQRISGPDLLRGDRYDILARASGPVTVGRLRVMLQDLLARRFQLTLHRETRMLPVYELVVAKGGPKLPRPRAATDLSTVQSRESLPRVRDGSFVFENATMADFAQKLSLLRGIELPVVDRTGIPGVFDITLKSAAAAILEPDGPSLFTLLQEQLGLKLVSAKNATDVLVIDRVSKASEN